jgi:UDP-N-acetylmuramoyl-tripeptide--D-alanyl-D-alanine ligase
MLRSGEVVVHLAHVREVTPEWVAEATGGRLHTGGGPVRDLHWHSGQVGEGFLFVALPGSRAHGREFAGEALAKGATLVLSDRPGRATVEVEDPYKALIRLGRALRDLFPGPVGGRGGKLRQDHGQGGPGPGIGFSRP